MATVGKKKKKQSTSRPNAHESIGRARDGVARTRRKHIKPPTKKQKALEQPAYVINPAISILLYITHISSQWEEGEVPRYFTEAEHLWVMATANTYNSKMRDHYHHNKTKPIAEDSIATYSTIYAAKQAASTNNTNEKLVSNLANITNNNSSTMVSKYVDLSKDATTKYYALSVNAMDHLASYVVHIIYIF